MNDSENNDELNVLIEQVRDGNSQAEGELFELLYRNLLEFAKGCLSRSVGRLVEPEDPLLSALRTGFRRISDKRERTPATLVELNRWLKTFVLHKAQHRVRALTAAKRDVRRTVAIDTIDVASGQPDRVSVDEKLSDVREFVSRLSEPECSILNLILAGCDDQEIAEALELSLRGIRRKKIRIFDQLRTWYQND